MTSTNGYLSSEILSLRQLCIDLDTDKANMQKQIFEYQLEAEKLSNEIHVKDKMIKALKIDLKRIEDISREIAKDLEAKQYQPIEIGIMTKLKRLFV